MQPEDIITWLRSRIVPARDFQQMVISGTTPAVANTEFEVRHDLNRHIAGTGPNGNEQGAEFIWWLNGAGTLYEGDRATWDANKFTLRCTEASRGYTIIVR